MKKTVLVLVVAVMVLGTMSVAFAESDWSPAKFFANAKGITEEEAYQQRAEGKTFGEMAREDEKVFEAFRNQALEQRKLMLNEMVVNGELTQEKADEVIAAFAECDGTMEQQRLLQETGLFGQGAGNGQGNGLRAMDGEGFGAREGGFGQGGGQMRRGGGN